MGVLFLSFLSLTRNLVEPAADEMGTRLTKSCGSPLPPENRINMRLVSFRSYFRPALFHSRLNIRSSLWEDLINVFTVHWLSVQMRSLFILPSPLVTAVDPLSNALPNTSKVSFDSGGSLLQVCFNRRQLMELDSKYILLISCPEFIKNSPPLCSLYPFQFRPR